MAITGWWCFHLYFCFQKLPLVGRIHWVATLTRHLILHLQSSKLLFKQHSLERAGLRMSCFELFHGIFQIPTLTLRSPDQSSPISLPDTMEYFSRDYSGRGSASAPALCSRAVPSGLEAGPWQSKQTVRNKEGIPRSWQKLLAARIQPLSSLLLLYPRVMTIFPLKVFQWT